MKLSALISPGTWELLERLRPHLDVTIDLFDSQLHALLPEHTDATSQRLRQLVHLESLGPARELASTSLLGARLREAMQTATTQLVAVEGLRIGLFPLRHERAVVGVLATAMRSGGAHAARADDDDLGSAPGPSRGHAPQGGFARTASAAQSHGSVVAVDPTVRPARRALDDPASRRIERLGWTLRATIEADIDTHVRLSDEQQHSRWLATTLRFLEHLHACESDGELAEALVQAAAIWGDVDARLYRRTLEGDFALHTALPSVSDPRPDRLPDAMGGAGLGPTRVTSIAELEQLGWQSPAAGEVLFMPVTTADRPDWMLAAAGRIDTRFERVLGVACRTLAGRFDQLAAQRASRLRARLLTRLAQRGASLPARAASALREVATATGATQARLLAHDDPSGPPRVLAAVGGAPMSEAVLPDRSHADDVRTPALLTMSLDVGLPRPARLELGTVAAWPFDLRAVALAETGAATIAAWLAGALHGLATGYGLDTEAGPGGFEERIRHELERARRFGTQAGVLVVDTTDSSRARHALVLRPLIDIIRSELRAADLLGRLEDGALAALLVHTDAAGTAIVAERLLARLADMARHQRVPAAGVGHAAFPDQGETVPALLGAARSGYRPQATGHGPG
jgi:GGDEF domain-containing protein